MLVLETKARTATWTGPSSGSSPNGSRAHGGFGRWSRDEFLCPNVISIVRLLMLTGCRLGEVVSLEWDWIKGKRIHLPDSKSGPRTVWLSSAARAVIDAIPRYSEDCPFLFPARPATRHIDNLGTQWHRIRNEAGLPGLRIHDLRHSWASVAAMNGVDMVAIAKLLGHALVETTERYTPLGRIGPEDVAAWFDAASTPPARAAGRSAARPNTCATRRPWPPESSTPAATPAPSGGAPAPPAGSGSTPAGMPAGARGAAAGRRSRAARPAGLAARRDGRRSANSTPPDAPPACASAAAPGPRTAAPGARPAR